MKTKILEIRDEGTMIPILCIDMNPPHFDETTMTLEEWIAARFLMDRCGYRCDGTPNIAITPLDASGKPFTNDYFWWKDRTMMVAHRHINNNWATLKNGDVVDVEYILGETKAPKIATRAA